MVGPLSTTKRIARRLIQAGSIQSLATNILVLALGLSTSVVVARSLQPEGRGELAAAMLWPIMLAYLGNAGFVEAFLYFSSAEDADLGALTSLMLGTTAILSVTLVAVGWLGMPWLLHSQTANVVRISRVYLAIIPLLVLTEFFSACLQGRLRFGLVNALRLLVPIGYFAGAVYLMLFGRLNLSNVIGLHLALAVARLLLAAAGMRTLGVSLNLGLDTRLGRLVGNYAYKVHIGAITGMANWRLDQVVFAWWRSPADLGLYVVAVNTSQMILVFSQAIRTVLTPRVARAKPRGDQIGLFGSMLQVYCTLIVVIAPVTAAVLWLGIPAVYGGSFRAAVPVSLILLIGSCFFGTKDVLGAGARGLGHAWLASRAELLASIVTVVLLFTTIPIFGIYGAALTSVVAYALAMVMMVRALGEAEQVNFWFFLRPNLSLLRRTVSGFRGAGAPASSEGPGRPAATTELGDTPNARQV